MAYFWENDAQYPDPNTEVQPLARSMARSFATKKQLAGLPVDPDIVGGIPEPEVPFGEMIQRSAGTWKEPTEQSGIVSETGKAAVRGLVGIPELAAQAYVGVMGEGGIGDYAKSFYEYTDELKNTSWMKKGEGHGAAAEAWLQGVEQFGVQAPFYVAAALTGGIPAAIIGGGTMLGMFGAQQYNQAETEALKQGLSPDKAAAYARETALHEIAWEVAPTAVGMKLGLPFFKLAMSPTKESIKQVIMNKGWRNYARGVGQIAGVEIPSEMATSYFQTEAANRYGVNDDNPNDAAIAAIGPTAVFSALLGLTMGKMHGRVRKQIADAIENPGVTEEDQAHRLQAMEFVSKQLRERDAELADEWDVASEMYVKNNMKMPLDATFTDFVSKYQSDRMGAIRDLSGATASQQDSLAKSLVGIMGKNFDVRNRELAFNYMLEASSQLNAVDDQPMLDQADPELADKVRWVQGVIKKGFTEGNFNFLDSKGKKELQEVGDKSPLAVRLATIKTLNEIGKQGRDFKAQTEEIAKSGIEYAEGPEGMQGKLKEGGKLASTPEDRKFAPTITPHEIGPQLASKEFGGFVEAALKKGLTDPKDILNDIKGISKGKKGKKLRLGLIPESYLMNGVNTWIKRIGPIKTEEKKKNIRPIINEAVTMRDDFNVDAIADYVSKHPDYQGVPLETVRQMVQDELYTQTSDINQSYQESAQGGQRQLPPGSEAPKQIPYTGQGEGFQSTPGPQETPAQFPTRTALPAGEDRLALPMPDMTTPPNRPTPPKELELQKKEAHKKKLRTMDEDIKVLKSQHATALKALGKDNQQVKDIAEGIRRAMETKDRYVNPEKYRVKSKQELATEKKAAEEKTAAEKKASREAEKAAARSKEVADKAKAEKEKGKKREQKAATRKEKKESEPAPSKPEPEDTRDEADKEFDDAFAEAFGNKAEQAATAEGKASKSKKAGVNKNVATQKRESTRGKTAAEKAAAKAAKKSEKSAIEQHAEKSDKLLFKDWLVVNKKITINEEKWKKLGAEKQANLRLEWEKYFALKPAESKVKSKPAATTPAVVKEANLGTWKHYNEDQLNPWVVVRQPNTSGTVKGKDTYHLIDTRRQDPFLDTMKSNEAESLNELAKKRNATAREEGKKKPAGDASVKTRQEEKREEPDKKSERAEKLEFIKWLDDEHALEYSKFELFSVDGKNELVKQFNARAKKDNVSAKAAAKQMAESLSNIGAAFGKLMASGIKDPGKKSLVQQTPQQEKEDATAAAAEFQQVLQTEWDKVRKSAKDLHKALVAWLKKIGEYLRSKGWSEKDAEPYLRQFYKEQKAREAAAKLAGEPQHVAAKEATKFDAREFMKDALAYTTDILKLAQKEPHSQKWQGVMERWSTIYDLIQGKTPDQAMVALREYALDNPDEFKMFSKHDKAFLNLFAQAYLEKPEAMEGLAKTQKEMFTIIDAEAGTKTLRQMKYIIKKRTIDVSYFKRIAKENGSVPDMEYQSSGVLQGKTIHAFGGYRVMPMYDTAEELYMAHLFSPSGEKLNPVTETGSGAIQETHSGRLVDLLNVLINEHMTTKLTPEDYKSWEDQEKLWMARENGLTVEAMKRFKEDLVEVKYLTTDELDRFVLENFFENYGLTTLGTDIKKLSEAIAKRVTEYKGERQFKDTKTVYALTQVADLLRNLRDNPGGMTRQKFMQALAEAQRVIKRHPGDGNKLAMRDKLVADAKRLGYVQSRKDREEIAPELKGFFISIPSTNVKTKKEMDAKVKALSAMAAKAGGDIEVTIIPRFEGKSDILQAMYKKIDMLWTKYRQTNERPILDTIAKLKDDIFTAEAIYPPSWMRQARAERAEIERRIEYVKARRGRLSDDAVADQVRTLQIELTEKQNPSEFFGGTKENIRTEDQRRADKLRNMLESERNEAKIEELEGELVRLEKMPENPTSYDLYFTYKDVNINDIKAAHPDLYPVIEKKSEFMTKVSNNQAGIPYSILHTIGWTDEEISKAFSKDSNWEGNIGFIASNSRAGNSLNYKQWLQYKKDAKAAGTQFKKLMALTGEVRTSSENLDLVKTMFKLEQGKFQKPVAEAVDVPDKKGEYTGETKIVVKQVAVKGWFMKLQDSTYQYINKPVWLHPTSHRFSGSQLIATFPTYSILHDNYRMIVYVTPFGHFAYHPDSETWFKLVKSASGLSMEGPENFKWAGQDSADLTNATKMVVVHGYDPQVVRQSIMAQFETAQPQYALDLIDGLYRTLADQGVTIHWQELLWFDRMVLEIRAESLEHGKTIKGIYEADQGKDTPRYRGAMQRASKIASVLQDLLNEDLGKVFARPMFLTKIKEAVPSITQKRLGQIAKFMTHHSERTMQVHQTMAVEISINEPITVATWDQIKAAAAEGKPLGSFHFNLWSGNDENAGDLRVYLPYQRKAGDILIPFHEMIQNAQAKYSEGNSKSKAIKLVAGIIEAQTPEFKQMYQIAYGPTPSNTSKARLEERAQIREQFNAIYVLYRGVKDAKANDIELAKLERAALELRRDIEMFYDPKDPESEVFEDLTDEQQDKVVDYQTTLREIQQIKDAGEVRIRDAKESTILFPLPNAQFSVSNLGIRIPFAQNGQRNFATMMNEIGLWDASVLEERGFPESIQTQAVAGGKQYYDEATMLPGDNITAKSAAQRTAKEKTRVAQAQLSTEQKAIAKRLAEEANDKERAVAGQIAEDSAVLVGQEMSDVEMSSDDGPMVPDDSMEDSGEFDNRGSNVAELMRLMEASGGELTMDYLATKGWNDLFHRRQFVNNMVYRYKRLFGGSVDFFVYDTPPKGVSEGARGVFYRDAKTGKRTVHLYSNNIQSPRQVYVTLMHEATHAGLDHMFGKASEDKGMQAILTRAFKGIRDNPSLYKYFEHKLEEVSVNIEDEKRAFYVAVEETLVHVGTKQRSGQMLGLFHYVRAMFHRIARMFGFRVNMTRDEMIDLCMIARASLTIPGFSTQARYFVDDTKMEKMTRAEIIKRLTYTMKEQVFMPGQYRHGMSDLQVRALFTPMTEVDFKEVHNLSTNEFNALQDDGIVSTKSISPNGYMEYGWDNEILNPLKQIIPSAFEHTIDYTQIPTPPQMTEIDAEELRYDMGARTLAYPDMMAKVLLPESIKNIFQQFNQEQNLSPKEILKSSRLNDIALAAQRFMGKEVGVEDNDIASWKKSLMLPNFLRYEHEKYKEATDIQERREEAKMQALSEYSKATPNLHTLKPNGPQLAALDKIWATQQIEGGKSYSDDQLRGMGLNDQGLAAYKEVNKYLEKLHEEWLQMQEDALFRKIHWEATFTPEEVKALHEVFERDIRKGKAPNWSGVKPTQAMRYAATSLSKNFGKIQSMRAEHGKLKNYFPLTRKRGKFFTYVERTWTDENGKKQRETVWSGKFQSESEALVATNELKKLPDFAPGAGNFEVIGPKRENLEDAETYFLVADMNLQRILDNAIATLKSNDNLDSKTANDLSNAMSEMIAENLRAKSATSHMAPRNVLEWQKSKATLGFETENLRQVVNDYVAGFHSMRTKYDAAMQFVEMLKGSGDMPLRKSTPKLYNALSNYASNMLRPQTQTELNLNKAKGFAFTWYLGFKMSAAVLQLTQNFVTGSPMLARELKKMGKSTLSLNPEKYTLSALKDSTGVVAGLRNSKLIPLRTVLTPTEQKLMEMLWARGSTQAQFIHSLLHQRNTKAGTFIQHANGFMGTIFGRAEEMNRVTAALSFIRLHEDNGGMAKFGDIEQQFYAIREFIGKTHYWMGRGNNPAFAQEGSGISPWINASMTFRRFTFNYFNSLYTSLFRDVDANGNRMAPWQFDVMMRSFVMIALFGGLFALPWLDDMLDIFERLSGIPWRAQIRKNIKSVGGRPLELLAEGGLPAYLGADFKGPLKIGIPFLGGPTEAAFGVWGGLAGSAVKGMSAFSQGDYLRGIEHLTPVGFGNVAKATRIHNEGAKTPDGYVQFDREGKPYKFSDMEVGYQMFGFKPLSYGEETQSHREFKNLQTAWEDKRRGIYARYRLAKTGDEIAAVMKEAQQFNMRTQKYRAEVAAIKVAAMVKNQQKNLSTADKKEMAFKREWL